MLHFNTVNAFDYVLIALYFAIVIWVGFYAARKNKGTADFFKASGQVPWFMAGVSSWVSGFSAFMFVAAAGYTYTHGSGALVIFTGATWAYLAGYFYFAPMWRRARIAAPLEFLTRRYSPSTTYFYTVTSIVPQIVGVAQGLYILCIFVSTALGFESLSFHLLGLTLSGIQAMMLVVGAVMILYSVVGGLWAAVLSDAVQGVIILVMSVIIFPVSIAYVGQGGGLWAGFKRLATELPHDYLVPSGQPVDPWFLASFMIASLLGYNVAWHFAQRYNSVPSERDAKKMALLGAGLSMVGPLTWTIPVMGARLIFPDMHALWPNLKAPEEASFVSLAMLLLPHGMIGFVVAAILSATLGQANDAFNWLSAAVTKDVYVPLRRRLGFAPASDLHQMRTAQLTMLVIGVSGVGLAFVISKLGGAFDFALKYYSIVGPGFSMPVMLGLIYRKTPWWSGTASCCAAFALTFLLMGLGAFPEQVYARNVLSAVVGSTVVFVISAFFWRADDPKSADAIQLDRDLRTPVPESQLAGGHGAMQVYGVIGNLSLVIGLVLLGCGFVRSTPIAPASINVIAGGLLVAIGLVLRWVARPTLPEPGA
ncbi:MAG: solute:Na+ symporter [Verrucomicrobia bacterium]|nr:MAG: solute:Na+ symporter [Verrucomicrobiota bacterium]